MSNIYCIGKEEVGLLVQNCRKAQHKSRLGAEQKHSRKRTEKEQNPKTTWTLTTDVWETTRIERKIIHLWNVFLISIFVFSCKQSCAASCLLHTILLSTDGPATINVNIYLRTISRIDDVKMVSWGLNPGQFAMLRSLWSAATAALCDHTILITDKQQFFDKLTFTVSFLLQYFAAILLLIFCCHYHPLYHHHLLSLISYYLHFTIRQIYYPIYNHHHFLSVCVAKNT